MRLGNRFGTQLIAEAECSGFGEGRNVGPRTPSASTHADWCRKGLENLGTADFQDHGAPHMVSIGPTLCTMGANEDVKRPGGRPQPGSPWLEAWRWLRVALRRRALRDRARRERQRA